MVFEDGSIKADAFGLHKFEGYNKEAFIYFKPSSHERKSPVGERERRGLIKWF